MQLIALEEKKTESRQQLWVILPPLVVLLLWNLGIFSLSTVWYCVSEESGNNNFVRTELAKLQTLEINLNVCNYVNQSIDNIIKKVNTSTTGGFVISKKISRFIIRNLKYTDGYLTGEIRFSAFDYLSQSI